MKRTGHTSTSVKVGVFVIANLMSLTFWFIVGLWTANVFFDSSLYDDTNLEYGAAAWAIPAYWAPGNVGVAAMLAIGCTVATWVIAAIAIHFIDGDEVAPAKR